jgi:hypothetical protein
LVALATQEFPEQTFGIAPSIDWRGVEVAKAQLEDTFE